MNEYYSPGARMLLGITLGDACGAPFENLSFQDATKKLSLVGISPGLYTDDTQQALAIAEIMASGEEISPLILAKSFLNAYARDPRSGYSRQTLQMLSSPDPESFLCSIPNHERSERKTDGAAMRAPPLGFFPDRKTVIKSAMLSASITHGHPDAIAATVAIALIAHERIYHDTPFPELWNVIREEIREMNPDVISWCDRCAGLVIPDREILLGEYAPYGVPYTESRIFLGVVIFLLTRFGDDPCTLLKEAIQVGGDTDTVAAVVLGIALVRGGEDSRIWDLVAGIEDGPYGREYVISIGNSLSDRFSESLKIFQ